MVTVCPPMVNVAIRERFRLLRPARNVTVAGPVPDAAEVIVSQPALLAAAHVQPAPVDSVIVPVLIVSATLSVVGDTVNEHVAPL
jgi:hypothetical protein